MTNAMQRPMGQIPAWLVRSGVAIGVVGASVKKDAESVGELVVALSGRTVNSDAAVAVALGQWGLLLLVAGAVVVVAGLAAIALAGRHKQRRRATDPGHMVRVRKPGLQKITVPSDMAELYGALTRR
jgi:hypothetical protein